MQAGPFRRKRACLGGAMGISRRSRRGRRRKEAGTKGTRQGARSLDTDLLQSQREAVRWQTGGCSLVRGGRRLGAAGMSVTGETQVSQIPRPEAGEHKQVWAGKPSRVGRRSPRS